MNTYQVELELFSDNEEDIYKLRNHLRQFRDENKVDMIINIDKDNEIFLGDGNK